MSKNIKHRKSLLLINTNSLITLKYTILVKYKQTETMVKGIKK